MIHHSKQNKPCAPLRPGRLATLTLLTLTMSALPALAKESKPFPKSLVSFNGNEISLPDAPNPVGNYLPYSRAGNLIFINQISLREGKVVHPGKLPSDLSEEQGKEATEITMLNVLAVLKKAVGGDLSKVTQCVQLTGIFNTQDSFTQHAQLMNVASDMAVKVFGEKGKHARATYGVASLPLNSPVEIQAIFEVR